MKGEVGGEKDAGKGRRSEVGGKTEGSGKGGRRNGEVGGVRIGGNMGGSWIEGYGRGGEKRGEDKGEEMVIEGRVGRWRGRNGEVEWGGGSRKSNEAGRRGGG